MNGYDRTNKLGLFPPEPDGIQDIETRVSAELFEHALTKEASVLEKDAAVWSIIHRGAEESVPALMELAADYPDPNIQRSASWGLFKLGKVDELKDSISQNDSGNTRAWKNHLLLEAAGSTERFDDRDVRQIEGSSFDVTMPLHIEGVVQFKDADGVWRKTSVAGYQRRQMVGSLTAGIKKETFTTELAMQKRIPNIHKSGHDFIEGYLFRGLSRTTNVNTMTHYYESLWSHTFYKSGWSGDDSQGTIDGVQTHLFRVAETDLANVNNPEMTYPQSVRGIFYGSVFINPAISKDPGFNLDGSLQIISTSDSKVGHLANGWFYGTFRGIPEDVDNDGVVELNGVEMFVNEKGEIIEKQPPHKEG